VHRTSRHFESDVWQNPPLSHPLLLHVVQPQRRKQLINHITALRLRDANAQNHSEFLSENALEIQYAIHY